MKLLWMMIFFVCNENDDRHNESHSKKCSKKQLQAKKNM